MKFAYVAAIATLASSTDAFAPTPFTGGAASALNLAVGESAPDFSLVNQNGKKVTRSQLKKPLVVFFYPADATPGCTIEATKFNERVSEIRKSYGADVVGISGQDVESKEKFSADLGLDFSILADPKDAIRKEFNVPKAAFGLLPGRVTYVLDKTGVCKAVFQDLADAAGHVDFAEKALAEIKASAPTKKSLFSGFN